MNARDDAQDLFCLHCGYNLRGQFGDPRRCPECGQQSTVADMLIPADQIRKALRKLESGPALANAMYIVLVAWMVPLSLVMLRPRLTQPPIGIWVILIAMVGGSLVLWVVGVWTFRRSAGDHPDWMGALVRYHLYGTVVAVCIMAVIGAALWGANAAMSSFPPLPILPIAACALLIVVAILAMRWAGERAKKTIAPIQRVRAAEMIRAYRGVKKE